jgi:hypothetical protein
MNVLDVQADLETKPRWLNLLADRFAWSTRFRRARPGWFLTSGALHPVVDEGRERRLTDTEMLQRDALIEPIE